VIHTVGPTFNESEAVFTQQLLLYNAVFNALKLANSLKCTSIALPAVSSGSNKFPLSLCAQIVFSAINNFLKGQQKLWSSDAYLKHIRVVNCDKPTTEFMKAEFEFICQTNIPSIEFEICKDVNKFQDALNKKLGKEKIEEPSFLSRLFGGSQPKP
jgi:hypothetical protein